MDRRTFLASAGAGLSLFALPFSLWAGIPGESAEARDQRLAWWREARFGMFIHWGIYAVPAGVYQGREVPGIGEWIMDRARIPVSEYEKFAPEFNPVRFDAHEWAKIAKAAGMKYLVITSKHHDGFCMFDSKLTDYDIMDAALFGRDVIRELSDACRDQGVRFGFYYSIMDWHHPDQRENFPRYLEYMKGQLAELLTNYGEISVIFFDGEWIPEWDEEKGVELEAWCRSFQPSLVINNRIGKRKNTDHLAVSLGLSDLTSANKAGDYDTPEQFIPRKAPPRDWETCMTMNDTWGYKKNDHNWKSTTVLVRNLIDIAAKGGNFLLNVGPTAEGIIPKPSGTRLAEMGKWMQTNGEAIYGTSAGPLQKLKWGRSTRKPGKVFLHVFDWPKNGKLAMKGMEAKVKKAYLLADPDHRELPISGSDAKLVIQGPAKALDPVATVVVLETR